MSRYQLTIFTPSFNRANTLSALYRSLCIQQCKDFEWIVVDDGSTDSTGELVSGWIREDKISIKYFRQENSGKMPSHNLAVDNLDSEWFMCVDSDDRLYDASTVGNCIEFLKSLPGEFTAAELSKICGVISLKIINGRFNSFPSGMRNVHLQDLKRSGYRGETSFMVKSSLLKDHKYPRFDGEKFVTDAYLYERLDKDHTFLLMNVPTQVCKYNPDGYSSKYRRLLFSNPRGYREYHNQRIALKYDGILRSAVCYDAISIRMGLKDFLKGAASPLLYLAVLPLGFCKYLYDSLSLKTFRNIC